MRYYFFVLFFVTSALFATIPTGYYNSAEGLTGVTLKSALHDIIDDHTTFSYSSVSADNIMMEADEDPNNANNLIEIYTGDSENTISSREHVWAKSHGDFGTSAPAGCDLHNLKPCQSNINSSRNNRDFDEGGTEVSGAPGNYIDVYSWEPRDEVKGDVARIIFYMATRYEGDVSGEPDLEVVDGVNTVGNSITMVYGEHGNLAALLQWHEYDPPDVFEQNRNDVIYNNQGNRNPFIDHPEYVSSIWGNDSENLETFANFTETSGSYISGSFTGQDGSTWSYTQCRGDQNITDETPCLGQNRTPVSQVQSGLISDGCGALSFDYMKAFSSDVDLDVYVNSSFVANVSGGTEGVIQNTGDITVNVIGDFSLQFIQNNTSSGQISIDNITWTNYMNTPIAIAASNVDKTSFSANWNLVNGATGYELDVATDSGFTSYVDGFNSKDVGNILTYSITELTSNTDYYYRVRAYNGSTETSNSNMISVTTLVSGGLETFANYPETGGTYQTGTFTGLDGSTWSYTQCRGDQIIDSKTPCIGKDRTPVSQVESGIISGGCGILSFDYMQAFSSSVNLDVYVNSTLVANISGGAEGVVQNSGEITVNISGDFTCQFIQNNTSSGQISIDNITWTDYSETTSFPPIISNINQSPSSNITSTTTVSISADVTDSDGTISSVALNWGTTSGILTNSINMLKGVGDNYSTESDIPAQSEGSSVYYKITAIDNDTNSTSTEELNYYIDSSPVTINCWINEFHYDNVGTDQGEFVEVALENASLFAHSAIKFYLYNGSDGGTYGDSYTIANFTEGNVINDVTFFYYNFPTNGIQNGPDGFALSYDDGTKGEEVIEFISYEGSFSATNGIASGQTSMNINVSESGTTPIGSSIGLEGTGTNPNTMTWTNFSTSTVGSPNNDQALPVTLSSFTASFSDLAILNWTTQSELNNSHWNVYRSISENFGQSVLANSSHITGAGTSFIPTDYEFLDQSQLNVNQNYYYWVESVDYSGNTELHGPVTLNTSFIIDNPDPIPIEIVYGLQSNYPNPFNPSTSIHFMLPEDCYGNILIYNTKGQFIKQIFEGNIISNKQYEIVWDGTDRNETKVSSGFYFYRLKTNTFDSTRSMLLLK